MKYRIFKIKNKVLNNKQKIFINNKLIKIELNQKSIKYLLRKI